MAEHQASGAPDGAGGCLGLTALRTALALAQQNQTGVMLSWDVASAIIADLERALRPAAPAPREAAGEAVEDAERWRAWRECLVTGRLVGTQAPWTLAARLPTAAELDAVADVVRGARLAA